MSSTFAGVFCASGLGHRDGGVFESMEAANFSTHAFSSPPTSHPTPTPRKPFRVGVGWRVGGGEQVENARRKIIDPTHSPPRLLAKVGSWPTRSSAPPFYEWRTVRYAHLSYGVSLSSPCQSGGQAKWTPKARLSETMCAAALHSVKSDLHSARAPAARSLTLSSLHPLRCKPRILAPHFHQALDTPTDGLRRPRAAHLGA